MNIVIVGGGLAGRTCACLLKDIPLISKIIIIEASTNPRKFNPFDDESSSRLIQYHHHHYTQYTGLWNSAIKILMNMGIDPRIHEYMSYIKNSGYRSIAGKWLASPSITLDHVINRQTSYSDEISTDENIRPSLGFIANNILLSYLDKYLFDDLNSKKKNEFNNGIVTMYFDNIVDSIVPLNKSSMQQSDDVIYEGTNYISSLVTTNKGLQFRADLIIGADGTFSRVRELIRSIPSANHSRGSTIKSSSSSSSSSSSVNNIHHLNNNNNNYNDNNNNNNNNIRSNKNDNIDSCNNNDFDRALYQYRGYNVFRGICMRQDLELYEEEFKSFQTWGVGIRFAVVPISYPKNYYVDDDDDDDVDDDVTCSKHSSTIPGFAWFAAISDKHCKQFLSRHLNNSNYDVSDGNVNVLVNDSDDASSSSSSYGPFKNSTQSIDFLQYQALLKLFKDHHTTSKVVQWHDPIPSILKNTLYTDISMTRAVGFVSPYDKLYSSFYIPSSRGGNKDSMINDSEHDKLSSKLKDDDDDDDFYYRVEGCPVVFIGDAAYTLDPILAQGAGIAVEDAYRIVQSLWASITTIDLSSSSSLPSSSSSSIPNMDDRIFQSGSQRINLTHALQSYHTTRLPRLHKLYMFSNISQWIGHIDNRFIVMIRDAVLSIIPNTFKSRIFDFIITLISK